MSDQDDSEKSAYLLHQIYGELLTLEEVAKILKFPSGGAVRKAIDRGTLDLQTIRIKGRRKTYVKTSVMTQYLGSL
jgi:hypothetical protein